MRLLVLTLNGAGNWPPERTLIAALVERGHEVLVISDAIHESDVRRIGATFLPYTHAKSQDPHPPGQTRDQLISRVFLNPNHRDELIDAAERLEPDVVLVDMMLWSAMAVAEGLRQPSVILWHTIYGGMPAWRKLGRETNRVLNFDREGLGLPAVNHIVEQAERAQATIVFTPSQFDELPQPLPHNLHYVGPLACLPDKSPHTPYELPWSKDDQRPLVLVSFSTSFQDQLGALQRVVDALGSVDVRGLVTVGPAIDGRQLTLPNNVRTESFVPHAQVIPEAKLVITHCGHGTTMAAVTAGIPMLCMPMGNDQFDVSARVIASKLGKALPHDAPSELLESVIREILLDTDLAKHCKKFAEEIDLDTGLIKAVSVVEQLG